MIMASLRKVCCSAAGRGARSLSLAFATGLLAACGQGGPSEGGFGGFPPAAVTLLEVKPQTVPIRFEYVGQAAGSREAEVRARVQGILERRSYTEGAYVKAGQTLFLIDPKPYAVQVDQAAAALAQAQAQQAQARRNLERLKPLVGDRAISKREFDDAVSLDEGATAAVTQARARLAEARLNLSYATVSAPVSGFVSRALKSEGSLVAPGADSLLTTVSQLDPIYVNFSIAESDQLRIDRMRAEGKLKAPAAGEGYTVSVRLADDSLFAHAGKLAFVDKRINQATGSFDARAELPNPERSLHPGQFVRVIVEGARRPDTVVLPQRAVLAGPQGKFVYVAAKSKEGKDIALPRAVTVGDWVELAGERLWIVESGLVAGDAVVVEGMAKIFPIPGGAPIALGGPEASPAAAPADAAKH